MTTTQTESPMSQVLETNEAQDDLTSGEDLGSMFSSALAGGRQETEQPASQPVAQEPMQEATSVAAQTEPVTPVSQPDPLTQLTENARRLGISTEGMTSAEQLASAMLTQIERMQPHVRIAQDIAPYADEIKEYIANRGRPVSAVAAKDSGPVDHGIDSAEEWNATDYLNKQYGGPVITPEHRALVESGYVEKDDATGLWVARAGYETAVGGKIAELNAAQAHVGKFWQNLSSTNPYEKFYNVLREPLVREVQSVVDRILSERETTTRQIDVVSKFENENKSWMYQVDPATGRSVPSARGSEFFETISELRESGISDPGKVIALASKIHGVGNQGSQTTQAQPQAMPSMFTPPALSQTLQPKAQPPAAPANQSFLESAMQRAGYSPSYTSSVGSGSEAAPEVVSQNELDSLFTNALRVASASR